MKPTMINSPPNPYPPDHVGIRVTIAEIAILRTERRNPAICVTVSQRREYQVLSGEESRLLASPLTFCTLERKVDQLLKVKHKALVMSLALLLTYACFSLTRTSASVNAPQNEQLDFTLVNRTGYSIKLLYIGPSNNPEWTDDMEFLKGKVFKTGTQIGV